MSELPSVINQFLYYMVSTKNRSSRTVEQYTIDLTLFFKYIICSRAGLPLEGELFDCTDISGVDIPLIKSVSYDEVEAFFYFAENSRENGARTRARKLSCLRSFYKFWTKRKRAFTENPVADFDSPELKKTLPKFLTADESLKLLSAVTEDETSQTRERDYAILTLFLNCGMRLSELTGINLSDIQTDMSRLNVRGKGSKERIIYLNDACRSALDAWLKVRATDPEIKPVDRDALFLSRRHQRISIKTVQWMVYKYLDLAGLGYRHLSTHKLRHTAATLMYQSGKVDIRVLKDILGHEQLNTTQIYTHVSDSAMEAAMEQNPLSGVKAPKAPSFRLSEEKTKKDGAQEHDIKGIASDVPENDTHSTPRKKAADNETRKPSAERDVGGKPEDDIRPSDGSAPDSEPASGRERKPRKRAARSLGAFAADGTSAKPGAGSGKK